MPLRKYLTRKFVTPGNLQEIYAVQKNRKYLLIINLLEKVHYVLLVKYDEF